MAAYSYSLSCTLKPDRVRLSSKPTSQLHFFTTTILHPQTTTKIRPFSFLHVIHPPKFRTCIRACVGDHVRKRAIDDAIDFRGNRVTIGDVVSKESIQLNQAQKALQALVAHTNGTFKISDEGDVVYVFPKYYRISKLFVKSFRMKIEYLLGKGKMVALFFMKILFGMSLAASSVVGLAVALYVTGWMGFEPSQSKIARGMEIIIDALSSLCSGRFIQYVFCIVFGEGDPNQGIEEKRWKMIGQYIALNGGVVTAEELIPYLDPETTEKMDDESYLLPVLLRFEGQPELDEEGNILYHFPSVYCTAPPQSSSYNEYVGRWADMDVKVDKFLKEMEWKFSKVDAGNIGYVNFILLYNLFCATILVIVWGAISRTTYGPSLSKPFLCYLFLPLLLMYMIYVGSFFAIASIRRSSVEKRNAEIVKRNVAREQCAKALELPDHSLRRKLLSARAMGRWTSIGNNRIVYSSEAHWLEQFGYERQEWDRRLKERSPCRTSSIV